MSITQETANLIATLAHAASQIGSTAASAKINQLIVELLPAPSVVEDLAEALRQDNAALQEELKSLSISERIAGQNLEVLRAKLVEITTIAIQAVAESASEVSEELLSSLENDLRQIITLAEPVDA